MSDETQTGKPRGEGPSATTDAVIVEIVDMVMRLTEETRAQLLAFAYLGAGDGGIRSQFEVKPNGAVELRLVAGSRDKLH